MSVKDVIKKGVLESLGGGNGLDFAQISIILIVACVIGIYIYAVYKNFFKASFYSRDLNVTLAGMTVIVAAIMVAMQSNLLVSLGMVGALSIVRFRTAVKNPLDLLYLFWAISAGIICGVSLYILAAVLCVIMTIIIWVLSRIPNAKAPILLIVKTLPDADVSEVCKAIQSQTRYSKLSTSSIKNNQAEYIYEIKTTARESVLKEVSACSGVTAVSLLDHDGELRA